MNKLWLLLKKEFPHLTKWAEIAKRFTLPGFDNVPIYEVFIFFQQELREHSLPMRSKSIAFSFFLALFPGMLFIVSLIPFVLQFLHIQHVDQYILKSIRDVVPDDNIYNFIEGYIHPLLKDLTERKRASLLTGSFIGSIFLTSNGVVAMMASFDKSYEHYTKRNAIMTRIVALKITLLLVLLFIISIIMVVVGHDIINLLVHYLHIRSRFTELMLHFIRYFIILMTFFFSISLIYYYGPATKQKYRFISLGATVATILSLLASVGFSYYVSNFNRYNALFGSIGTIMLLMVWLNVNAFVLIIGYEINASIQYNKTKREIEELEIGEG